MVGHTIGFDIAAAARAERSREAREAEDARKHVVSATAEAERLARQIAAACGAGVERVVLFGSLARGDAKSPHADIDLAVFPSVRITWPPANSLPQAHLPGAVATALHWHSGPQAHQKIARPDFDAVAF